VVCQVQHNQISINNMSSSSSSYVLEDAVNTIYKHLSSMLYNKFQVIKCIEESADTDVPDHIVDDNLYFENFHQIVQQLVPYPLKTRLLLLNEAFNQLYSTRSQFTTQIDQLYYEHFNPNAQTMLPELQKKRAWPDWNVKFLNISEIIQNIQTDVEARRVFYKNDPLLSYNRCPCQKCKVDWKTNHKKIIGRSNSTEKMTNY
jgi:hypothetical protein